MKKKNKPIKVIVIIISSIVMLIGVIIAFGGKIGRFFNPSRNRIR